MVRLIDKVEKQTKTTFGDLVYGQAFLGRDDEIYLKTAQTTAVRWSKSNGTWVHAEMDFKGEAIQYSFDFNSPVIPYKTTITIERA